MAAVAAVAAAVAAVAAAVVAEGSSDFLADRASQIGEAWLQEYLHVLRAQAREPVGGWPGTMSEARGRVVAHLAVVLAPERLEELARLTNLAAKRGWQKVSEPDPEF